MLKTSLFYNVSYCFKCHQVFHDDKKYVSCSFCKRRFHLDCIHMDPLILKHLIRTKRMKWFCNFCIGNVNRMLKPNGQDFVFFEDTWKYILKYGVNPLSETVALPQNSDPIYGRSLSQRPSNSNASCSGGPSSGGPGPSQPPPGHQQGASGPSSQAREPNLMPVPSPQQIQYLNTFEGQELIIQKQPNIGLKEGNIISPPVLSQSGMDNTGFPSTSQQDMPQRGVSGPNTPTSGGGPQFPPTPSNDGCRFSIPSPHTPNTSTGGSPNAEPHSGDSSAHQNYLLVPVDLVNSVSTQTPDNDNELYECVRVKSITLVPLSNDLNTASGQQYQFEPVQLGPLSEMGSIEPIENSNTTNNLDVLLLGHSETPGATPGSTVKRLTMSCEYNIADYLAGKAPSRVNAPNLPTRTVRQTRISPSRFGRAVEPGPRAASKPLKYSSGRVKKMTKQRKITKPRNSTSGPVKKAATDMEKDVGGLPKSYEDVTVREKDVGGSPNSKKVIEMESSVIRFLTERRCQLRTSSAPIDASEEATFSLNINELPEFENDGPNKVKEESSSDTSQDKNKEPPLKSDKEASSRSDEEEVLLRSLDEEALLRSGDEEVLLRSDEEEELLRTSEEEEDLPNSDQKEDSLKSHEEDDSPKSDDEILNIDTNITGSASHQNDIHQEDSLVDAESIDNDTAPWHVIDIDAVPVSTKGTQTNMEYDSSSDDEVEIITEPLPVARHQNDIPPEIILGNAESVINDTAPWHVDGDDEAVSVSPRDTQPTLEHKMRPLPVEPELLDCPTYSVNTILSNVNNDDTDQSAYYQAPTTSGNRDTPITNQQQAPRFQKRRDMSYSSDQSAYYQAPTTSGNQDVPITNQQQAPRFQKRRDMSYSSGQSAYYQAPTTSGNQDTPITNQQQAPRFQRRDMSYSPQPYMAQPQFPSSPNFHQQFAPPMQTPWMPPRQPSPDPGLNPDVHPPFICNLPYCQCKWEPHNINGTYYYYPRRFIPIPPPPIHGSPSNYIQPMIPQISTPLLNCNQQMPVLRTPTPPPHYNQRFPTPPMHYNQRMPVPQFAMPPLNYSQQVPQFAGPPINYFPQRPQFSTPPLNFNEPTPPIINETPVYRNQQMPVPQYNNQQMPVPQYYNQQMPVPQYNNQQMPVPQYTTPQMNYSQNSPAPQFRMPPTNCSQQMSVPNLTTPPMNYNQQVPVPHYDQPIQIPDMVINQFQSNPKNDLSPFQQFVNALQEQGIVFPNAIFGPSAEALWERTNNSGTPLPLNPDVRHNVPRSPFVPQQDIDDSFISQQEIREALSTPGDSIDRSMTRDRICHRYLGQAPDLDLHPDIYRIIRIPEQRNVCLSYLHRNGEYLPIPPAWNIVYLDMNGRPHSLDFAGVNAYNEPLFQSGPPPAGFSPVPIERITDHQVNRLLFNPVVPDTRARGVQCFIAEDEERAVNPPDVQNIAVQVDRLDLELHRHEDPPHIPEIVRPIVLRPIGYERSHNRPVWNPAPYEQNERRREFAPSRHPNLHAGPLYGFINNFLDGINDRAPEPPARPDAAFRRSHRRDRSQHRPNEGGDN